MLFPIDRLLYSEPKIIPKEPSSSIVFFVNVKIDPDFVSLFNFKNKKYLSAVFQYHLHFSKNNTCFMWHITCKNHTILDFKDRLLNILKSLPMTFSFLLFSNCVSDFYLVA